MDEDNKLRLEEYQRRKAQREANLNAWNLKTDPYKNKNLDSNLKKHNGFISKCRTRLAADTIPQLIKETEVLKLEKYISEIISALAEGLQKCKQAADVSAVVELISRLHQRFTVAFTLDFSQTLHRLLRPPSKQQLQAISAEQREKEESSRVSRQRILIRVFTELWLVGIFYEVPSNDQKDKTKNGLLLRILKDLILEDKEFTNLPIIAHFAKFYGEDVLGIRPRRTQRKSSSTADVISNATATSKDPTVSESVMNSTELLSDSQKQSFQHLFNNYYVEVSKFLVREHKHIKKMEKRSGEWAINRGEITEEVKQTHERAIKTYEKLLTNVQNLADSLNLDFPELPEDEATASIGISVLGRGSRLNDEEKDSTGIWEDEDAKKFYEELMDLKTVVPAVLLDMGKKKKAQTKDSAANNEDTTVDSSTKDEDADEEEGERKQVEEALLNMSEKVSQTNEDEDTLADVDLPISLTSLETEKSEGLGKSGGQSVQLESLLARLPNVGNRDVIDQVTIEFCYLNSKSARRRLAQVMIQIPRNRLDLLPYYCRMIATLYPYLPDVGNMVLAALEDEFRALNRSKKRKDFIESRIKNARYLAELTKFQITPLHVIFHCIKVLLDDFSTGSIEVLSSLLETCGRFLFKMPETHPRMVTILETIIKKKKAATNLDHRILLLLDNAYFSCNPPEKSARIEKIRTPLELFIRKLVLSDLNKENCERVLKMLRKLPWHDGKVINKLFSILTKPWKIRYSNLHLFALLVSGIHRYHPEFGIGVVDRILENIRSGLETNLFKLNQHRIATVRYLGEMYNYRMVDSTVIFETLYNILTFGYENGLPNGQRNPTDPLDDFFRIRLCCTLLDTCGMYFDRGTARTKLDYFLIFLQFYILTKQSLPMDVDFSVSDTFETLRPNMTRYSNYDVARNAFMEILKNNQELLGKKLSIASKAPDEYQPSDASVGDEEESENEDDIFRNEDRSQEPDYLAAEVNAIDESNLTTEGTNEDEEVVVLHHVKDHPTLEEEEDFEKELGKLVVESIESRKYEKKAISLDVPIPLNLRAVRQAFHSKESEESEEEMKNNEKGTSAAKVEFVVLTKRGGKQQIKVLEVPETSSLAINAKSMQAAEKQEQEKLKQLVLNYEEREAEQRHQEGKYVSGRNRKKVVFQSGGGGANQYSRR